MTQSLQSMTGYSRAAGSIPGISFAIEIKSVNARGLDIRMRMTPGYDALEAEVRRRIGKALTRGSISVNLTVDREGEGGRVVVNKQALEAVMSAIAEIAALTNSPRPTPDGILGLKGVLEQHDAPLDPETEEKLQAAIYDAVDRCLGELRTARGAEGAHIEDILSRQVDEIARLRDLAAAHPGRGRDAILGRLREQIADLMASSTGFSEERLTQEALLLATKADIRDCLERWNEGDNGILDHSKAYRLKPGTGWLIPPAVLHAPGSLVTYEPQWGSDVFGMYQSMVEGRRVPWDLLVKDVPEDKHHDLDYLIEQLDWEKNVDPHFKANNYLEPIVHSGGEGHRHVDKWIVYGTVDGEQLFSARELTVLPGASVTIKDDGAYGLIVVQGSGHIGKVDVDSPNFIRFGEVTKDEVFVTAKRAAEGVTFTNTGSEPFVSLRYFGPGVHKVLPAVGDHLKVG